MLNTKMVSQGPDCMCLQIKDNKTFAPVILKNRYKCIKKTIKGKGRLKLYLSLGSNRANKSETQDKYKDKQQQQDFLNSYFVFRF